jgi:integrase
MRIKLTDRAVRELPHPARGSKVTFDSELTGFGLRATPGAKAFVLSCRIEGRQRQLSIGGFPEWPTDMARKEAARLKRLIDLGRDPMRERLEERQAPRMKELARRYLNEHAIPYKSPKSVYDDRLMIRRFIDPTITIRGPVGDAVEAYQPDRPGDREIAKALGDAKVRDVDYDDIDDIHHKITLSGRPVTADRVTALLSKMLSFAERKKLRERGSNPCKGAARNAEIKREKVLTDTQLGKLLRAVAEYPHRDAADVIMLALLTGARQGELLQARWAEIDFDRGVWDKPQPKTKQRRSHHVPLGVPALRLLKDRHGEVEGPWIFPGRHRGRPLTSIKKAWRTICDQAGIPHGREEGFTAHDLRHQFASLAVSGGATLPMIGGLLGHTVPTTTARYAHLFDQPLREVSDAVGRRLIPSVDNNRRPA